MYAIIFDRAAEIIRESGRGPVAFASLIVLVLGIVGAYLFRNVGEKLRLAAFAMVIVGLLGLFTLATTSTIPFDNRGDSNSNTPRVPEGDLCAIRGLGSC